MIKTVKLRSLDNEQGMISIITTMVFMALLTLIVLGFASLAGREQRQALDQELNTQAFYAAESGVNEAIHNNWTSDRCPNPSPLVASDSSVTATCTLVDPTPETLEYSEVSPDGSIVVPIKPSGSNLSQLTISWQDKNASKSFATECDHKLYNKTDWATYNTSGAARTGLVRMMLIPGSFVDRNDLIKRTHTVMLYPLADSITCGAGNHSGQYIVDLTSGGGIETKGEFVDGMCNTSHTPRYCNVNINFNGAQTIAAGQTYYLRLKAIYQPVAITITAKDSSGNRVSFQDAQTVIDSTGKTTDVLRRIQVHVPSKNNLFANKIFPEFAVETTDTLCKRLSVIPGVAPTTEIAPGDPVLSSPDNSICQPN